MVAGRIPLMNSTNFSSQRGKSDAIKSHAHTAVGFIGSRTQELPSPGTVCLVDLLTGLPHM
ncbi:hypothetical protein H9L39_04560 [Fusarium oxysporum f. sp. albedinis]|jgi:hypothetical protein|nr:hypothetical protein H9L39_04560 [Fusarium oxysporum f. sp. albedinis]